VSKTQQNAFSGSLFESFEDSKSQREYLELLTLKARLRQASEEDYGDDAPALKALAGVRTPEEALQIRLLTRLNLVSERDPKMLKLRSVYGNVSKFELARTLASALIQKRDSEAALAAIMGPDPDATLKRDSQQAYDAAMVQSSRHLEISDATLNTDAMNPAALIGGPKPPTTA
jgi:hypothetical protein